MKEFTIIKKYSVPGNSYTGGAVKVGAAVQVSELYEKLDTQGLVAIGGECAVCTPTPFIAPADSTRELA